MMIGSNCKRLVIYFFYDNDGIVDRYVGRMLEEIKANCSDLYIVVNGRLSYEGRAVFRKYICDESRLLVRENVGFDVWAYKSALENYGWDALEKFDEIVMMNHTIMGPLYPFSEMFGVMNRKDVDFWGITKFHELDVNPYNIKYGCIPEHIQSHFIAVRRTMIKSVEFHDYWENRPPIQNYFDAISKHEAIFTRRFSDCGFKWDVYVDTTDMEGFTDYPLSVMPVKLIREYRCPIFKRRSFFQDYAHALSQTNGEQAAQLMSYLKNETDYDISMIWENLLRTCNMADLHNCLNLNYVINSAVPESELDISSKKTALVMHIYYEDLIGYCYEYACSMPENADVYITVNSEEMSCAVKEVFSQRQWHAFRTIIIENRGRDVSALLVGAAPYISGYDYVCFMHDKKVGQLDFGAKGWEFSERCFKNNIGTKELVRNIIRRFEDEPQLGMLCPPPPYNADYYPTWGLEWGPNWEPTKKIYDRLDLTCPIDGGKEPIAPYGTMFWFRPEAMKKLFDIEWKTEDFPMEPNGIDGTILHGMERVYPFVVQDAGYYPAWMISSECAANELSNMYYFLRTMNFRVFNIFGGGTHNRCISTMDKHLGEASIRGTRFLSPGLKAFLKKIIPRPVWEKLRKLILRV